MSETAVAADDALLDCPRCASAGSVYRWTCEICEGERPPATLHPSIPVRFADVVAELGAIADMASRASAVDGQTVAAACRRAASLLSVLRRQFVSDLVEPQGGAAAPVQTFTSRSHGRPGRFTSAG